MLEAMSGQATSPALAGRGEYLAAPPRTRLRLFDPVPDGEGGDGR